MVDVTRIIIDASVVMSWLIPDELTNNDSQMFLDYLEEGTYKLLAPDVLAYEVVNTLKVAVQRKRLDENLATQAINLFFGLQIELIDPLENLHEILNLATKYDISGYDAAYTWLAQHSNSPLFTFDKKLAIKIQDTVDVRTHL